jgi:hypothetical protein
MKTKKYTSVCLLFLVLLSCKKKEVVDSPSTSYQSLGTYDSSGKPNYLLDRDNIPAALLEFVKDTFPNNQDLRITNPQLLTTAAQAELAITQASDVFITFVTQAGNATNTLAFYTYPTNQPPTSTKDIKVITYIFPHAGGKTPLQAGDKVKIGRFNAGTSVGFILIQRGWDTAAQTINNKWVHFYTHDALNPEADPALKRHAVQINYIAGNKVIIGFEDVDRTQPSCDHDFNDVVFFYTVSP